MKFNPLLLKDETPQNYALRLFRSLAKCSFFDLVYTCYVEADYNRSFFTHIAVLLQNQEGYFKFDRCNEELAFRYLCGDYSYAGAFKLPLAVIEIGKTPYSVLDFFNDWQCFFSRIYRENLWSRATCLAPAVMDFSRFDAADYETVKKLYSNIEEDGKK